MLSTSTDASVAVRRLGLVEYGEAWELQRRLLEDRQQGRILDTLVLLQHPHTYTFGRRAVGDHLLLNEDELRLRGIATYWVDRGGDVTYHGPGQIVGYPIIDLRARGLDVHRYLRALEEVLIQTLAEFGIEGERDPAYTGVWVPSTVILSERAERKAPCHLEEGQGHPAKIAAIGVKVSRGVTCHGFALNVNTDLSYFHGIVPCGIRDRSVTSLERLLGREVEPLVVEEAVEASFVRIFS